jgi:hypothetical protein
MATTICAKIRRQWCLSSCPLNSAEVICRDSGNRCAASGAGVSLITKLLPAGIEDPLCHTQGAGMGLPGRAAR